MNLMDTIKKRRSIRSYKNKAIEIEKLDAMKEALNWAPSAGNMESRHFYFVTNNILRRELTKATRGQHYIEEAPLCIVGCAELTIKDKYGQRGSELYAVQDVACSFMNAMLMAHSLELGSVWIGAFDENEVSKAINLPDNHRPVAMLALGYPNENPEVPDKKSIKEMVTELK